eukprot:s2178_g8.t1
MSLASAKRRCSKVFLGSRDMAYSKFPTLARWRMGDLDDLVHHLGGVGGLGVGLRDVLHAGLRIVVIFVVFIARVEPSQIGSLFLSWFCRKDPRVAFEFQHLAKKVERREETYTEGKCCGANGMISRSEPDAMVEGLRPQPLCGRDWEHLEAYLLYLHMNGKLGKAPRPVQGLLGDGQWWYASLCGTCNALQLEPDEYSWTWGTRVFSMDEEARNFNLFETDRTLVKIFLINLHVLEFLKQIFSAFLARRGTSRE